MMRHKDVTSAALAHENIETVTHVAFVDGRSNSDRAETNRMIATFRSFQSDVVVKPSSGKGGDCVFRARTEEELIKFSDAVFQNYETLCLSPFIAYNFEYRTIVLDRKVLLAYSKTRRFDQDGNKIEWRHNLGLGARTQLLDWNDISTARLTKLASRAADALGARFASIDILEDQGRLRILEANSVVMMDEAMNQIQNGMEIATNVYSQAVSRLFGT
jgi:glutathione synthase/RimK-type ligase-like ATP-grasp enzyme